VAGAEAASLPKPVGSLLEGIEHWRETREKRSPMPEELWDEAVKLARVFGVYVISRDLRLNYARLKERVETETTGDDERDGHDADDSIAFVEVGLGSIPEKASRDEVVVEVRSADGSEMTIRLPSQMSMDVGDWVGAFVARRR
jgi:hypothetical protein